MRVALGFFHAIELIVRVSLVMCFVYCFVFVVVLVKLRGVFFSVDSDVGNILLYLN